MSLGIINIFQYFNFLLKIASLRHLEDKICVKIRPHSFQLFVPESTKTDAIFSFNFPKRFFEKFVMTGHDQSNDSDNQIFLEVLSLNLHAGKFLLFWTHLMY